MSGDTLASCATSVVEMRHNSNRTIFVNAID
jgi:hypothetical protein